MQQNTELAEWIPQYDDETWIQDKKMFLHVIFYLEIITVIHDQHRLIYE